MLLKNRNSNLFPSKSHAERKRDLKCDVHFVCVALHLLQHLVGARCSRTVCHLVAAVRIETGQD